MTRLAGAGRGRGRQHPPRTLEDTLRFQLAPLVRGSSATAHCYAATALLTREYQGDDRRQSLTSAATRASHPLDFSFHISVPAIVATLGEGRVDRSARGEVQVACRMSCAGSGRGGSWRHFRLIPQSPRSSIADLVFCPRWGLSLGSGAPPEGPANILFEGGSARLNRLPGTTH